MDINLSRARTLQVEVYAKKFIISVPLKSRDRNRWEFIKNHSKPSFQKLSVAGGRGRKEGEGGGGGGGGEGIGRKPDK